MPLPAVSVIIPAYRHAEHVNQAVASVLRQTFADYELIVVDDASSDEVVRQYRFPNEVRFIQRMVNSGRAAVPRNEGYRVSRGKYLAFLDMDDLYLPDKLASQVAILEAHPQAALTFCHRVDVDETLRPFTRHKKPRRVPSDCLREMVTKCLIRTVGQTLIRRDVFEALGGFDENIVATADWDLYIRLAHRAPVIADPKPRVLCRRHAGQQSQNLWRMRMGNIAVLEKTNTWLPHERPDLAGRIRRRLARSYFRLARMQMARGDEFDAVWQSICTGQNYCAFHPRAVEMLVRAAWYGGSRIASGKQVRVRAGEGGSCP